MDTHFLKLLVCPLCNSPLRHDQSEQELICQYDQLAYPIRNGIPIMLKEEARSLGQTHSASAATGRAQDSSPSEPAAEPAAKQTDSKTPGSPSGSTPGTSH